MRRRLLLSYALVAMLFASGSANAHDPSAYGGLFRSRDFGGTWLNADVGLFLGAALSLAIDPDSPDHLLLGTDTGLLASQNGGRAWVVEERSQLFGAVFSVVFLPGGKGALCATPAAVFRHANGSWQRTSAPGDAVPARAIVVGATPDRIHLIGRRDLFHSEDSGRTWTRTEHDLQEPAEFTELVMDTASNDRLIAIVSGKVMASSDGGRHWALRTTGLPGGAAEGLSLDPLVPGRKWVGSASRVYVSDDQTFTWRALGTALPEAGTNIRAIAARQDAQVIVVATHRGLYRSLNVGQGWAQLEDNLPVHLDSRPLLNDPSRPGTLYAGFSLMPHAEIWRVAVEGGNLLARADPVSLAGGVAFLLVVVLAGVISTRWLLRRSSPDTVATMERRE